MAIEWAKYNITANSISPGRTDTPMSLSIRQQNPELGEQRNKRVPLGRTAQVQDMVNVAIFLASGDSDYITGEDILVDGGQHAVHSGFSGLT